MASTFKFAAAPTSRGTVLTTELNALANSGFSALGTAYDNTTNLDEWGVLDINLATLTPTTGALLQFYMACSADGTTYEDPPSSTNAGSHQYVTFASLNAAAGTKRVTSAPFRLYPGKAKFSLQNLANVALGATGNTVTLYTWNEQAV